MSYSRPQNILGYTRVGPRKWQIKLFKIKLRQHSMGAHQKWKIYNSFNKKFWFNINKVGDGPQIYLRKKRPRSTA
jgi:hypothetical protein